MKPHSAALMGMIVLLAAACSATPPREREANALARYEAFAGEPVDSMWFQRLHSWESLGEEHVLVRTTPSKAYLLTVERPCSELPWANAIGLTSTSRSVHARFDHVLVNKQRCRILEIRPVDDTAARKAKAAEVS